MTLENPESPRPLTRRLRDNFLAGLLVVIPASIVILILVWLFVTVDSVLQPIIRAIAGTEIIGLGFAISVVVIYLVGLMTRNYIGNSIVRFGESIMAHIPLARQVYQGTKQVIAGLSGTGVGKAAFREVVLVEFPRPGMKTVAFVTNEMRDQDGKRLLAVFVPTAPVPTSGYFEILTEDMVTCTDISVDQAMQMVISSGMVSPEMINTGGKVVNLAPEPDSTAQGE